MFNSQTYMLTVHKQREENDDGLQSATSPPDRKAAGSPTTNIRTAAMIGAGVMVANRIYKDVATNVQLLTGSTMRQEQVNQAMKIGGYMTAIIATKGWAAVPIALSEVSQIFWRHKRTEIENQARDANRALLGMRYNNNMGGSAYYD